MHIAHNVQFSIIACGTIQIYAFHLYGMKNSTLKRKFSIMITKASSTRNNNLICKMKSTMESGIDLMVYSMNIFFLMCIQQELQNKECCFFIGNPLEWKCTDQENLHLNIASFVIIKETHCKADTDKSLFSHYSTFLSLPHFLL